MTPNPEFAGKRLGVTFVDGEARTRDIIRAKEFSEIYGYEVVPFPDAPTWEELDDPMGLGPGAVRPEWEDEEASAKRPQEVPLNRPEGQLKPRKVKDEIAGEKAFSKAIQEIPDA